MAGEEEKKRKREERTESLGWLTESSIMPRKHRAIEGVGAGSILELKAQLYKTQQQAKDDSSSTHDRRRDGSTDLFSKRNSGVEARAKKDKLEMKAIKDGAVSYAALEKKAELYEKLSKGELSDEEEKEKYCVDFFQKTLEDQNQSQPSNSHDHDNKTDNLNERDGDDVAFVRVPGLGRARSTVDRDEHKRFVREIHEEAREEREKATSLKMRRQEQEAARREKLRQTYLKKQLNKLLLQKQDGTNDNK
ncbi:hypothetical protein LUZ60_008198 [Juncus effusus]|nr:hypothetical protein LUZ60_008198 [Juncus effusus]